MEKAERFHWSHMWEKIEDRIMTSKKQFLTLVELVMALSLLLLVLLPVSMATTMAIKDWDRSRDIRMLQEDLHLASLTIKGVIEEASGYQINETGDEITLLLEDDTEETKSVTIRQDDTQLLANDMVVVDCLAGLEFEPDEADSVRVQIEAERSGQEQENVFVVKLRNYQ
jgi:competence protein ComGC